jgi:CTP synthase (UTP-ammonia lyase)
MSFIEAFRQFQFRVKRENFCNVHVSLIPVQNGEHKTKPTQNSVKELRGLGISPDMVKINLLLNNKQKNNQTIYIYSLFVEVQLKCLNQLKKKFQCFLM